MHPKCILSGDRKSAAPRTSYSKAHQKPQTHPSPKFDSIPVEILIKILLLASPKDFAFQQSSLITPNPLLSVCRQWRAVVFKVPEFWASLKVDTSLSKYVCKACLQASLIQWLERAQSTPLYIHSARATQSSVWQLLFERAAQWREWTVRDAWKRTFETLNHAQNLRRLIIMDPNKALYLWIDTYSMHSLLTRVLGETQKIALPQLESLALHGPSSCCIPFFNAPRLTNLTLTQERIHDLIDIVSISLQFPLLKLLEISGHILIPIDGTTSKFPRLEVVTCDLTALPFVLPMTPRLETLHVQPAYYPIFDGKGQPHSTVHTLHIKGPFCWAAADANKVFSMLPSVRKLIIDNCSDWNSIIKLLLARTSLPLLPDLENLTIRRSTVSLWCLVSFSESRTSPRGFRTVSGRKVHPHSCSPCLITLFGCQASGEGHYAKEIKNIKNADVSRLRAHRARQLLREEPENTFPRSNVSHHSPTCQKREWR